MIRKLWPGLLLNLGAAVFGFMVLDRLPERVASHWGANGEVNGHSSRLVLMLLVPILSLVMAVVLAYAPQLDPKRRNFPMHAGAYWIVTNAILVFLAVVHVMVIGFNLGWHIDINVVMGIGLGLLFMLLGNLLTRVRPNWIFGVRTPWTLSSDLSWRESHRVAGYGFVAAGLAVFVTACTAPKAVVVVMLVGVGGTALVSVVWSYFVWKRDPNAQGRDA
jgi:uncharacterized membrane protein